MAALWQLTGLHGTTIAGWSSPRPSRRLSSVVYAAAVYSAYACLFAASACDRLTSYYGRGRPAAKAGGNLLQIRLIRDTDAALLFVATTAVYWSAAAYGPRHERVYEEHVDVTRRLFGDVVVVADRCLPPTRMSSHHRSVVVQDACCWTLYALLAVILSLDVYHDAGPAVPWTYSAAYVWGHYALLTGNVQFAVTVFRLWRCYCELNERMMRAGRRQNDNFDCTGDPAGDSSSVAGVKTRPTSSDFRFRDVTCGVSVLDKVNLLTILKHWSDLHWSITQIVSRINNLFKFRLFIFFLCGLLHLMLTPYLLSLTILNEDVDILPHIIERTLWFVIHVFRVVLMIYPCALLGEEIETHIQQLDVNKPEFSIYSMFVIDRQLVITLTGAVATYLVIILQLQGQS